MRLCLELRNEGSVALKGMRLVASSPCLRPGTAPLPASAPLPAWDWASAGAETGAEGANGVTSLFTFPAPYSSLAPGAALRWPLWLHASDAHHLSSLHLSLCYLPGDDSSQTGNGVVPVSPTAAAPLRFRLLRLALTLAVKPQLLLSATCAAAHAGHHLVRLSVADAAPEGAAPRLRLRAATASGGGGNRLLKALSSLPASQLRTRADGSATPLYISMGGEGAPVLSLDCGAEQPPQPTGALAAFTRASASGRPQLCVFWEECGGGARGVQTTTLLSADGAGGSGVGGGEGCGGLSAWLTGPTRLSHDFKSGPAVVTFRLHVRNEGPLGARPRVQLLTPEGGGGGWAWTDGAGVARVNPPGLPSAPSFSWLGVVDVRWLRPRCRAAPCWRR